MDNSANQRVKNQRQARIQAGWQEVRVWVPTKDDAKQVQELAAKLRAKILDKQGLEQLPGVKAMCDEVRERVLSAIQSQDMPAYVTPSGAFLELLTELAKKGHLADMSAAFEIFVEAHPSNAKFVASSVGSKVMNHYFIPSLGLDGSRQFLQWQEGNPNWATMLTESLLAGHFQRTVDNMLTDIKGGTAPV